MVMAFYIRIELLATLKRYLPESAHRFPVRPQMTVRELIGILGIPDYEVNLVFIDGIKANLDWKDTLGSEWRQYENIFPALAKSSIDQVSLECIHSKVPAGLMALLKGKDVLVGVIDVAADKVETPREVAATIGRALRYVPKNRLYPCTNCGMAPMDRDIARAKLRALTAGAALARERYR